MLSSAFRFPHRSPRKSLLVLLFLAQCVLQVTSHQILVKLVGSAWLVDVQRVRAAGPGRGQLQEERQLSYRRRALIPRHCLIHFKNNSKAIFLGLRLTSQEQLPWSTWKTSHSDIRKAILKEPPMISSQCDLQSTISRNRRATRRNFNPNSLANTGLGPFQILSLPHHEHPVGMMLFPRILCRAIPPNTRRSFIHLPTLYPSSRVLRRAMLHLLRQHPVHNLNLKDSTEMWPETMQYSALRDLSSSTPTRTTTGYSTALEFQFPTI